mmetsp:Transcript_100379/g.158797  ORF Transcript_100379/g.158797 Transcript_100379/m.158797 type:complete len:138 (-) Transcript_100379:584-997(-)
MSRFEGNCEYTNVNLADTTDTDMSLMLFPVAVDIATANADEKLSVSTKLSRAAITTDCRKTVATLLPEGVDTKPPVVVATTSIGELPLSFVVTSVVCSGETDVVLVVLLAVCMLTVVPSFVGVVVAASMLVACTDDG